MLVETVFAGHAAAVREAVVRAAARGLDRLRCTGR
jgi:hypothetical protein